MWPCCRCRRRWRCVAADDTAIHYRGAGLGVDAAAIRGRVGADGAAVHRREAGKIKDAAAVGAGCVARTISADGAAILDCQCVPVEDATTPGCRVSTDGAAIHRRRSADLVVYAASLDAGCVARACPTDGAAVLDDQRSPVVDTAAVGGRVAAYCASIHRRVAVSIVKDTPTERAGRVARTYPANGAAVLDGKRGVIIVIDAAAVGGRVGADDAAIHRRDTVGIIVNAAAVAGGRIARVHLTDGAVGDVQCAFLKIVDAAAVGGRVVADGAAIHHHVTEV